MTTTTDLSMFGTRELHEASRLINAMNEQGLPEKFYDDEVTIMMNTSSGNVFLTNSDYQTAMINENDLEMWYFTPYGGFEGFSDELIVRYENGDITHDDDIQYLVDYELIELDEDEEEEEEDEFE